MASPGSLAGGSPREVRGAPRSPFLGWLWALLAGPRFEAELAAGIRPTTSICHAAHGERITTPRACRRVADALRRAVDAAERPSPYCLSSRVPIDAGAVRACRDQLLALADRLADVERPPARGVAIARQLVHDGCSPLFLQAPDRRKGADRRLACTLDAAQRALEVSGDFDRPEDLATAT
jgi:hypothetical protein